MNPTITRLVVALGVATLLTACNNASGGGETPGTTTLAPVVTSVAAAPAVTTTAAARGGPRQSLTGMWEPSDGTATKKFSADGRCTGMLYSGGKPLDIGGPMTCMLSTKADSMGRFTLAVEQSVNSATYLIAFTGTDTASVYKGETVLYTMVRQ